VFEGLSTSMWLLVPLVVLKTERRRLADALRTDTRRAAIVGAGIYFTYSLVLISMAFVTNVSYVVAFRQLSVPLGVTLGVLVLREPRHTPKFVGVALMSLGLFLVATG
jgi:uncharacterized membrane protein